MKHIQKLSLIAGCALMAPTFASADEATHWNNVLLSAIKTTAMNPPRASRAMAMVHLAMYDAVNAIEKTHKPYLYNAIVDPSCSKEAAAAQAAYQTLSNLFPTLQATFDAELNNRLGMIAPGQAKNDGIAVGLASGNAMVATRTGDGSTLTAAPYTGGTNPGQWRPTFPGFAPGLLPRWREVTPFGMVNAQQFQMPGPPSLTSQAYTDAYNEVKLLGAKVGSTRNQDQSDIAQFWADGGGTSTPPGHWLRIAADVGTAQGNTLAENARMFALMSMAGADAAIACWDMKYVYDFWRPITGIREGDNDTNNDTVGDAAWESFIPTPPFPSFTSGHSTFSGSMAEILKEFFGTDNISFTTTAEGFALGPRSFTSFSQASDEAALSRLYGGIHWSFDNEVGLTMGRSLGGYMFKNFLQPVPEPGTIAALGLMALGLICRRRRN